MEGWRNIVVAAIITAGVLWGWSIVAILRHPEWHWERARRNRKTYLWLTILLGLLGSLIYLVFVRPDLKRAGQTARRRATRRAAVEPALPTPRRR